MKKYTHNRGFTIVELVVVVVVIGILVAITAIGYRAIVADNQKETIKVDVRSAAAAAAKYRSEHTGYAETLAELDLPHTTSQIQYTPDNQADSFCVTATLDGKGWYIQKGSNEPKEGTCIDHGLNGSTLIANYIPNPRPVSSSVFTLMTPATGALQYYSSGGFDGGSYVRRTITSAAKGGVTYGTSRANRAPVVAGTQYTVSAWVRANKGVSVYIAPVFYAGEGALATVSTGSPTSIGTGWTRISHTFTPPGSTFGDTNNVGVKIGGGTGSFTDTFTWQSGDYLDVDALMVSKGASLPSYGDGTKPGCKWTGTPDASTSYCP